MIRFNPKRNVWEFVLNGVVLGWCGMEVPDEERELWADRMWDEVLRGKHRAAFV